MTSSCLTEVSGNKSKDDVKLPISHLTLAASLSNCSDRKSNGSSQSINQLQLDNVSQSEKSASHNNNDKLDKQSSNSDDNLGIVGKILQIVKGESLDTSEDRLNARTSSMSSRIRFFSSSNGSSHDVDPTDGKFSGQRRGSSCTTGSNNTPGGSIEIIVSTTDADSKPTKHDQLLQSVRKKYKLSDNADYFKRHSSNRSLNKKTPVTPANSIDVPMRERSARSVGSISQMRQVLHDRGQQLGRIEMQSEAMKDATSNLSTSMSKLADKYKNKKWYEP